MGQVMNQLQYAGVLETIRIRQSGYAVRLLHDDFVTRFRLLRPQGPRADASEEIQGIANAMVVCELFWAVLRIGKYKCFDGSKVYLVF
jgi:myosin heavy subunit